MKITTATARDQLPTGTVVQSAAGTIGCRTPSGRGLVFGSAVTFVWEDLQLPLTVLHHPDPALPSIDDPAGGAGDSDRFELVLIRRPDFWLAACVFGSDDSDMAGDGAYGHGSTAGEALAVVLTELGIATPTAATARGGVEIDGSLS